MRYRVTFTLTHCEVVVPDIDMGTTDATWEEVVDTANALLAEEGLTTVDRNSTDIDIELVVT